MSDREPPVMSQFSTQLDCYKARDRYWQDTIAALSAERDALVEENERLKCERDNWKESAREFLYGHEYYRDELDKCLSFFGQEAYVSDDGTVQDEPLRAKASELVGNVVSLNSRYKEALELISKGSVTVLGVGSVFEIAREALKEKV